VKALIEEDNLTTLVAGAGNLLLSLKKLLIIYYLFVCVVYFVYNYLSGSNAIRRVFLEDIYQLYFFYLFFCVIVKFWVIICLLRIRGGRDVSCGKIYEYFVITFVCLILLDFVGEREIKQVDKKKR